MGSFIFNKIKVKFTVSMQTYNLTIKFTVKLLKYRYTHTYVTSVSWNSGRTCVFIG